MVEWWEAAPMVSQQATSSAGNSGNWWEAAPTVSQSAPPSIPDKVPAPANLTQEEFMKWAEDRAQKGTMVNGVYHSALTDEDYDRYTKIKAGIAQGNQAYMQEPAITHLARSLLQGASFGWEPQLAAWASKHIYGNDPDVEEAAQRQQLDTYAQQHPTANFLSQGAGVVTSLGATGIGDTAAGAAKVIPNIYLRASALGAGLGGPMVASEEMANRGATTENALSGLGKGAVSGAIIGPIAEGGTNAISSTVAPWISDQAQYLADRYGIRVPVGAAMGNTAARVEQASQSVPFSGSAVRGQYQQANEDLVRAVNNEASAELEPHGFGFKLGKDDPVGRASTVTRGDQIKASYDDVIPRLKGDATDGQFLQDIDAARNTVPAEARARFDQAIDEYVLGNAQPNGQLDGQDLKGAFSNLGQRSLSLVKNIASDDNDRRLGFALGDVKDALSDMWARHSAARDVAQLKATDRAYGIHLISQEAETSSAAASTDGVYGPSQLWNAVKKGDPTKGDRALSRGEARLQDLAETAKAVFGKSVADSGTPERSAVLGLAGLTYVNPPAALATVSGLASHAAAYTNTGQNVLRGLAGSVAPETRQAAANALRTLSPGMTAATTAQQPYDSTPRTEREWQALFQQKRAAASQAISYYGAR